MVLKPEMGKGHMTTNDDNGQLPNVDPAGGIPEDIDTSSVDKPKAKDGLEADLAKARADKHKAEKAAAALEKKLTEMERAGLSELERIKAEKDDIVRMFEAMQAENKRVEGERARAAVAAELGLSPALAARLRGENEDELRADANELLDVVKGINTPAPKNPTRTARTAKDKPAAPKDQNTRLKEGILGILGEAQG